MTEEKVICPICMKAITIKTTTENFGNHLKEKHERQVLNMIAGKFSKEIWCTHIGELTEIYAVTPGWCKYPTIDAFNPFNRHHVLSVIKNKVFCEQKRDGGLIAIFYYNGELNIYTHNQRAEVGVDKRVRGLVELFEDKLKEKLTEGLILYAELIYKGKSPAQFEMNEEDDLVAFDLLDTSTGKFLLPEEKKIVFEAIGINFITLYKSFDIDSVETLNETIDLMIEESKELGWEGVVIKWYDEIQSYMIKAKVEQKYPKPKTERKKVDVDPRTSLEMSEIRGAINKVHMEIGPDIHDKRIAMPMVAKAVAVEEKKHGKKNRESLFPIYMEYVKELIT